MSDRNNGYLTCMFMIIDRRILLRMRSVLDKRCRENQNTFSVKYIFFFDNCAVCKIMREHISQSGEPQMTVLHMRFAYWIPKAKSIHSEYVTFTAFPRQQWLHERASVLRNSYISCIP
jgi:hypothetical protein